MTKKHNPKPHRGIDDIIFFCEMRNYSNTIDVLHRRTLCVAMLPVYLCGLYQLILYVL